jgi:diguanylate cyclase (GGDEF)-like protein
MQKFKAIQAPVMPHEPKSGLKGLVGFGQAETDASLGHVKTEGRKAYMVGAEETPLPEKVGGEAPSDVITPVTKKTWFDAWQGLNPTLKEIILLLGMLLGGFLLKLPSGLQALTFIPIIRATRSGGREAGILVAFIAVALTGFIELISVSAHQPYVLICQFTLRGIAYGVTIALVDSMVNRLHKTENLALTDPLTGVFNRLGFATQVESTLNRAMVAHRQAVLVLIDLDDFKILNDVHGHQFGDEILRTLVRSVHPALACSHGVFGRTGGDEFQIVFTDANREEIDRAMVRAAARFSDQTLVLGHRSTFSFGIAESEVVGYKVTDLIEAADVEMYHRKATRNFKNGLRLA